jgi:hypothetical protein
MNKPVSPHTQVPQLKDVIRINDSLRPAVLPWSPKVLVRDALKSEYLVQDVLAEEVIERVQNRITDIMPELIREAVEHVLTEHAKKQTKSF